MKYSKNQNDAFNRNMYNRLLYEYGYSDIRTSISLHSHRLRSPSRDRSHSVTCRKAREPGFLPLKDIPPSLVSGSCTVNVSPCAISKQVICDFSLFPWQLHKREHYRLGGPKIVVMISLRNWMHFSTIKF